MARSRRAFLAAAAGTGSLLAGCSGDGASTATPTATPALWNRTDLNYQIRSLSVERDRVFAVTIRGDCHVLSVESGEQQYSIANHGSVEPPTVRGDRVYIGGTGRDSRGNGTVYAVDLRSGEPLWFTDVAGLPYTTPVVVDDTVFFGALNYGIYAMARDSGDQRWSESITGGVSGTSPQFEDGVLFASGEYDTFGYDVESRETVWENDLAGNTGRLVDGAFAFGTEDGAAAVDATDGSTLWTVESDFDTDHWGYGPGIADETLVFNHRDVTFGVDTAGEKRWEWTAEDTFRSAPSCADGLAYLSTTGGTMQVLDAETGDEVWSFRAESGEASTARPVVADGRAYFADHGGTIYALDSEAQKIDWQTDVSAGGTAT